MGKPGPKKILLDFTQWTTSHGFPHVGRSKHICLIIFWVLITVAAIALLVWQIVMLVLRFRRYDVSVGLELRFEKRAFPAVTVCDLNPYRYSAVQSSPEIMSLLDAYQYQMKITTCGNDGGNFTNEAYETILKDYHLENIRDTVALQAQVRDYLVMLMATQSADVKKTLSTQRASFLKSCSFNTEDCGSGSDDFMEFLDPKLGTCFTFNPNEIDTEYSTSRAGPLYGLRLILLTNTSDYLPISEMAGFKIVLHNQSEQVFPDTYGYNVEVGTATAMGISFKEIIRLPHPYGDCVAAETQMKDANFTYLFEKRYTSEGCQRSCFQQQIMNKCGCTDPNYPDVEGIPRCNPTVYEERTCWSNFVSSGMDSKICNCQLPCEEGVYDVTVSGSTWPSSVTNQIADCNGTAAECQDQYLNNGALVEIYYEQLNYQLLEETGAYEFVNLASDFGGQIGLWLGLSVISIIEFFVVGFQVCMFYMFGGKAVR